MPVYTSAAKAKAQIMTGQDHDKLAAEEIHSVSNPLQKHRQAPDRGCIRY